MCVLCVVLVFVVVFAFCVGVCVCLRVVVFRLCVSVFLSHVCLFAL